MIVCHGCLWKYRQIAIGCWLVCICVFVCISICKMHLHIHICVCLCMWVAWAHPHSAAYIGKAPILALLSFNTAYQETHTELSALLHKARITQVCGIDASHAWLACGHCQFCRALEFRNHFILVTKTSGWLVYLGRALILRPIQHSEPRPSRCQNMYEDVTKIG